MTGEFPPQRASNAEKSFHLMTSSWNCWPHDYPGSNEVTMKDVDEIYRWQTTWNHNENQWLGEYCLECLTHNNEGHRNVSNIKILKWHFMARQNNVWTIIQFCPFSLFVFTLSSTVYSTTTLQLSLVKGTCIYTADSSGKYQGSMNEWNGMMSVFMNTWIFFLFIRNFTFINIYNMIDYFTLYRLIGAWSFMPTSFGYWNVT